MDRSHPTSYLQTIGLARAESVNKLYLLTCNSQYSPRPSRVAVHTSKSNNRYTINHFELTQTVNLPVQRYRHTKLGISIVSYQYQEISRFTDVGKLNYLYSYNAFPALTHRFWNPLLSLHIGKTTPICRYRSFSDIDNDFQHRDIIDKCPFHTHRKWLR